MQRRIVNSKQQSKCVVQVHRSILDSARIVFLLKLLSLLLVVVVLMVNSHDTDVVLFVQGYPNEAGACHANQAAVGGSHVSLSSMDNDDTTTSTTTKRLVQTGEIDDTNSFRRIFINGKRIATTSTIELQYGIEYIIEIVSSNGHPFKGLLLRMESLAFTQQERERGVSTFTLLPVTNTQFAEACTGSSSSGSSSNSNGDITSSPIQGMTHYDNTPKFVFSSSLIVYPPAYNVTKSSYYAMDVTIVDYNNVTGSVYWYSQYSFEGVVRLSNDETIILPKETETTVPSPSPTTSPYPTYQQKCYVCGTASKQVVQPDELVILFDESASCGEIEMEGHNGLIPPQHCTIVQAAVADVCGCQDISLTSAPVASPLLLPPTTSKNTNEYPTLSPTVTSQPTNTALPTYSEKCYVCNGDPNQIVLNALQLIQINGITGSCLQLYDDGRDGYLYPELCPVAQTIAMTNCNCTSITSIDNDTSPTKSPAPSASPYPTYSEKCYVCNDDPNQIVTARDEIVHVNDRFGTCYDLQQQGLQGYIHPSLCSDAQQIASTICECKLPEQIHSPPTSFPTYNDKCYVCGNENMVITHNKTLVLVHNEILNCEELWEAGMWNLLPPQYCDDAQSMAAEFCGCTSTTMSSPAVAPTMRTLSPTITAQPTITSHPTYLEKCDVCNNNIDPNVDTTTSNNKKKQSSNSADSTRDVRNADDTTDHNEEKSGVVEYDGVLWDCNILIDLGATGNISPSLCPAFQELAQLHCPCALQKQHHNRDDIPLPKSTITSHATAVAGTGMYGITTTQRYLVLLGIPYILSQLHW